MISRSRQIARWLFSRFFVDVGGDASRTVFIAGTGRSGTTWVGDLVNHQNQFRTIFEPFHPTYVPECGVFAPRPYMPAGRRDEACEAVARAIVTGKLRNRWADGQNLRPYSTRREVKEIRANLMLKWLRDLFPSMPLVLCLRHPCAVVGSRSKLGWHNHLDEILGQPEIVRDHFGSIDLSRYGGEDAGLAGHAAMWAIETLVPLRQLSPGEVHIVFYENLCVDPRTEVARLFEYLQLPYSEKAMLAELGRPSWVTSKTSAVALNQDPLTAWQRKLEAEEVSEILAVVDEFGLGGVYGADAVPDVDAAHALLAAT